MKFTICNLMARLDPAHDGKTWINDTSIHDIQVPDDDVAWIIPAPEYNFKLRFAWMEAARDTAMILHVLCLKNGTKLLALIHDDKTFVCDDCSCRLCDLKPEWLAEGIRQCIMEGRKEE